MAKNTLAARPDRLPLKWGDWPSDDEVLIVRNIDGHVFAFEREFPCGPDDYVLLREVRGATRSTDSYMVPAALVYYRDLGPGQQHRPREKKIERTPEPQVKVAPVEGVGAEVPSRRRRGRPPKKNGAIAQAGPKKRGRPRKIA